MNYGVPYMGSKNRIAADIVEFLPEAENFYDLFAGGCAVTHAALLSGKYRNVYANDLDFRPVTLFRDAIDGKYDDEERWISREDFSRMKDTDPYVALCWSFGNNAKDYLYGRHIEPWKRALHHARVFHDASLLREMGILSDGSASDIKAHEDEYKRKYAAWACIGDMDAGRLSDIQNLERLARIKGLHRLQSVLNKERVGMLQGTCPTANLHVSTMDYREVEIKPGSVVYCDIPYKAAKGYKFPFDHGAFYDWCGKCNAHVFISEYAMPEDRFKPVWQKRKRCPLSTANRNKETTEKIFIPI